MKYNNIVKKKLKFKFYSGIDFKKLSISPYDFSKILGILLDNSIEAASKSNEKEITLDCEIDRKNNYQITLKNSYTNKDVDLCKIYSKGYSSKSVKSGLRIMGSF